MSRTFINVRNPYALPAKQRRAGAHNREKVFEEETDQDLKVSYITLRCDSCKGSFTEQGWKVESEEFVPCSKCGELVKINSESID